MTDKTIKYLYAIACYDNYPKNLPYKYNSIKIFSS